MQSITIINTGDFLKVLKTLLSDKAGKNAHVIYDGEIEPQDKTKPIIKVLMPEIDSVSWSDDGRHQDELISTILVKAPKNLSDPAVVCMNIAGFIRGTLTEQYYTDYLPEENDHVDEPQGIEGQALQWDTNDHGYEITFSQKVRYGTIEKEPFQLVAIDIKETDGESVRLYESNRESDT